MKVTCPLLGASILLNLSGSSNQVAYLCLGDSLAVSTSDTQLLSLGTELLESQAIQTVIGRDLCLSKADQLASPGDCNSLTPTKTGSSERLGNLITFNHLEDRLLGTSWTPENGLRLKGGTINKAYSFESGSTVFF